MGLRERVQQAIAGPVGESERLLNDLPTADAETKLKITRTIAETRSQPCV